VLERQPAILHPRFEAEITIRPATDQVEDALLVKGRIRIEMERKLRQSDVRGVVIRAGDFFGAGRGSWFDLALAKDLRRGICTYPGPADVATAWAYLPDLARAFVAVAERRARLAPFELLHFAGYSVTGRQWAQALEPVARQQQWVAPTEHLKLRRLPWTMIRLGAGINPMWGALAEMRYLWNTPHALANERLSAMIGVEPHRPLAQAARAALADLGLVSAREAGTTAPLPLP
jgi:nucleoside-diphosphate-sugar epimerase